MIGGGSIYRQFMPIADRLYITHVHKKAPADIYFPEIDLKIWEMVEKEEFHGNRGGWRSRIHIQFMKGKNDTVAGMP